MIDEEIVGQQREITGQSVAICDFCRLPVPRTSLVRVEGASRLAEPVEALHICESCRERIERGEFPLDEEIAAGLQESEE
jgi:hypothetical protein